MKQEKYDDLLQQLDFKRIPTHIAVIMDGNGRWAATRHLPRSVGHKAGAEALRGVTEICREIGVKVLTAYAFSTENWRRSAGEVNFLMNLLVQYLHQEENVMNRNQVRLGFLGKEDGLSPDVKQEMLHTLAATAQNQEMLLNLAFNYGGRDELIRAVQKIAGEARDGALALHEITEDLFSAYLDTAGQPDPDLLIRPSGEQRLSNFLLWQLAYSEFYFSDIMWPDFGKRDLLEAVLDYQKRDRRFGGVK